GLNVAIEDSGATDDDGLRRPLALDPAADVDPGEDGQIQVKQDEIERPAAREKTDTLRSVGGLDDLETLTTQELRDQAAKEMLVLDQQELPCSFPSHGLFLIETGVHPCPLRPKNRAAFSNRHQFKAGSDVQCEQLILPSPWSHSGLIHFA